MAQNLLMKGFLRTLEFLAGITIPLILIIIGYEIKFSWENFLLPLKIITIRIILFLLLAFLVSRFLFSYILQLEDPIFHIALYSLFVLQPPFVIPLLIPKEKSQSYILNTLSLGTIITIIFFILLSFYYQQTL